MRSVAERDDLLAAYREFIRENTLRFERAIRSISAEIREELRLQRKDSREYFEVLHAQGEQESRRVDELIEESRAQRQALLHILDRLDDGGTAPAG
jgi:hypothetical protein